MTRYVLATYAALIVGTAAAAVIGFWCGAQVGAPYDALDASMATAASLLMHNGAVALWPLALVALGWPRIPFARWAGDALVAGHLVSHALAVGVAVGAQPELWRFLPHLPAEWLGLATPAAGWLLARREQADAGEIPTLAVVSLAALVVAAVLETWAVPL